MGISPIERTTTSAKAWAPDVNAFAPTDVLPQALILRTSTVLGRIEGDEPVLRVAYVDDAAAEFYDEGAPIDLTAPTLAETLIATRKIGMISAMSYEQFSQPGAAKAIADAMAAAIIDKADQAYLAQPAPTGNAIGPSAGLLNVAGITDGGSVSDSLDALVDAVAATEAAGATPSHIILDPLGWAALAKIKAEKDGAASLLGAGTNAADKLLLGLPVLVNRHMPARSGLVIDQRAVVSAVGDVRVAQSEDAFFQNDSVGLRSVWRIGANVVHPERIAKFTVGVPAK